MNERTQVFEKPKPQRASQPLGSGVTVVLQRKCSCGGTTASAGGECDECKKQKLQRRATSANSPPVAPPIVHDVLNSPGQPLDHESRSFFEPRFGHSFGNVRVHTDEKAAQSARAVSALAYTVGHNIVFDRGQFAPRVAAGQILLAHELTHVIQQGVNELGQEPLTLGQPDDTYERQAERISSSILESAMPAGPARATPRACSAHRIDRLPVASGAAVIQRQVPTGIALKESKPFGHADLKSDDDKKKYLTNIGNVSLLQLLPAGDYTAGQKKGECTKEFLTEVSNTCPSTHTFCQGDRCLEVNRFGNAGDPKTGMMVTDGPDTFIDRHIVRSDTTNFLQGSGESQCSVVCHQLYKYRTEPDKNYHELGAFYIIRNFKADTYTPKGSTTPVNITTGSIQKIAAPSTAPTKAEFAKNVAPGLVRSGTLLDAPPVPQPPPPAKKAEDKK